MLTQENQKRRAEAHSRKLQAELEKYKGVERIRIITDINVTPKPEIGRVYEVVRVDIKYDKVLFVIIVDDTELYVFKEEVEIYE